MECQSCTGVVTGYYCDACMSYEPDYSGIETQFGPDVAYEVLSTVGTIEKGNSWRMVCAVDKILQQYL